MERKNNRKKASNIILNILIIIFTLLIIFFAWKLVTITLSYAESRKEYDELREFILPAESEEVNTIVVGQDKNQSEVTGDGEKVMREAECNQTVDFESLWDINPDIKGWIYLEALDISYPVVQGETNDDYIYTSVKGTANNGGSIFMDYRNGDDFSDPHTLIYGHNMKDGSMFGKLKKSYDQEFVDEWDAPLCFWIITPEAKYRYDIFSIHTVSATGDAYTLFSGEGEAVAEYINKMARFTGVELPQRVYDGKDKVITLSTCTSGDEYRLVVQGVLHVE